MITNVHEFLKKLPKKDLIDLVCYLSGCVCYKVDDKEAFYDACRQLIEEAYKEIKSPENG